MKPIYKRELSLSFRSMMGYIFIAFMLLFGGIYFMSINLNSGYSQFEYVPSNMTFIYIIAIPILTMKIMVKEKRQHTDRLLYSLPVSMAKVVMGKYFAMLTILAIPIAVMGIYPLILRTFGYVNLGMAYVNLLAFFLLGATLVAVGMFISTMTDSQAVAVFMIFLVVLGDYFLPGLTNYVGGSAISSLIGVIVLAALFALIIWYLTKSPVLSGLVLGVIVLAALVVYILNDSLFMGLISKIMVQLCVFSRFSEFRSGIVKLSTLAYYLGVISLFVYLSVQALEKRRWN